LKAGAATATVAGAAGLAGLAGTSCANLFADGAFEMPRVPLPDMDAYLRKLDSGLEFISDTEWTEGSAKIRREKGLFEEDRLGRKALRSLYLAGMFLDLPDEGQVHPGMQARMRQALPEMEEAVFGFRDYLEQIDDDEAARIQRFLNEHDDPGMLIAEQLERHAGTSGVSTSRRLKTRAMIKQIVSRLKKQPPRNVFDDYIGKLDRHALRAGSEAEMERRMMAMVGEQAFWERQQRLAMMVARWEEEGLPTDVPIPNAPPTEAEADAGVPGDAADAGPAEETADGGAPPAAEVSKAGSSGDETLENEREKLRKELDAARKDTEPTECDVVRERRRIRGAWTLGIGGITLGVGGVFLLIGLAADWAFFVAAGLGTIGAILLIVGAIIFIVRAAAC